MHFIFHHDTKNKLIYLFRTVFLANLTIQACFQLTFLKWSILPHFSLHWNQDHLLCWHSWFWFFEMSMDTLDTLELNICIAWYWPYPVNHATVIMWLQQSAVSSTISARAVILCDWFSPGFNVIDKYENVRCFPLTENFQMKSHILHSMMLLF